MYSLGIGGHVNPGDGERDDPVVDGPVEVREVEKLEGEILSLEAMRRHYLSMESWSQLVFDDLVAGARTRVAKSPLIVDLDPAP
jgi:predicted NUDIX family phosphoesterase